MTHASHSSAATYDGKTICFLEPASTGTSGQLSVGTNGHSCRSARAQNGLYA